MDKVSRKTVTSYMVKLRQIRHSLDATVSIYRAAVEFLIKVVLDHYDIIQELNAKESVNFIEHLVHNTKNNKASYPSFDKKFYKFPSYYRRAAISDAIAHIKSYMELKEIQETTFLDRNPDFLPCFFKGNTFNQLSSNVFQIKVFNGSDWVWLTVKANASNMKYLRNHFSLSDLSCPRLVKRHHGWSLRFAVERKPLLKYVKDIDTFRALGVDLGINTDATCSAICKDGTVNGAKFINSPLQKDRLNRLLNDIKKAQQNGNRKNRRLWSYVDNYNKEIAIRTAKAITEYAIEACCQVIVFENLSSIKPRGGKKQKIALWRKRDIQKRVETMAKAYGIRVAYICPRNTSRLAFDGSGLVTRGKDAGFKNNKLCRFDNGKIYSCDLSASKNIAARYLLRALQKSMSEKAWSEAMAKVPELSVRTNCTLSTLISLNAVTVAIAA